MNLFEVPEIMPGLQLQQEFINELRYIIDILLVDHLYRGVHVF